MGQVLNGAWALLLGMMLLMVGNGLQGTLLGVRGEIEGFSTFAMSIIMSAYFAGFLGASQVVPGLIRRVGHVRVFAALGSLVSATLIAFPALADPTAWTLGRVVLGFCFCGLYITAESWLNNATTAENRGTALSLYMIVQMTGIVAAQGILLLGDPSGYILFVIPSILVSLAFTPILLSIQPTPPFETSKPMTLRELYRVSPLGCVGMFVLGGIFSAQFGMAAVFGTLAGLDISEISAFVAVIYVGAVVLQFPIGFVSDRIDRRVLIFYVSALGGGAAVAYFVLGGGFYALLATGFLVGGTSNPLYALLVAYTNDYIEYEDMAAASGRMLFINGVGAIMGPLITGWVMQQIGANGFFLFIGVLMIGLAIYAAFRMTQRTAPSAEDDYEATSYAPVLPTATTVALEVAQEIYIETDQEPAEGEEID